MNPDKQFRKQNDPPAERTLGPGHGELLLADLAVGECVPEDRLEGSAVNGPFLLIPGRVFGLDQGLHGARAAAHELVGGLFAVGKAVGAQILDQ